MTSLFQYISIHWSVAIFQLLQGMEFTFHNSYTILELVPEKMIFWTDLWCWGKSYSNKAKAKMLQGWIHVYKQIKVVITNELIVTKYLFLRWQWIIPLLCRFYFVFLYHPQYCFYQKSKTLNVNLIWKQLITCRCRTVTT